MRRDNTGGTPRGTNRPVRRDNTGGTPRGTNRPVRRDNTAGTPTGVPRPPRRRPVDPFDSTEPLGAEFRDTAYVAPRRDDSSVQMRRPSPNAAMRRWVPAGVAAAVLVAVVAVSASSGADNNTNAFAGTTPPPTVLATGSEPLPTDAPPVIVTEPAVNKTKLKATLKTGSTGAPVKALQQRLLDLGFWPTPDGVPTGTFGPLTKMAVWAYEKLVLATPSTKVRGVVTNAMWQGMQDDILIRPRRPETTSPAHLEIYLDMQVAIIFQGTTPKFISHISSGKLDSDGKPAEFHETIKIDTDDAGNALAEPKLKYIVGYSKTPIGVFQVSRKIEGKRVSRLGGMLNPVYFNQGIAIHGGYDVPRTPASHGCVRVPNAISHVSNDLLNKGDFVYVFNGVKEPENATARERAMLFDRPDPDAPTTTTTEKPTTTSTKPAKTTTSTKPGKTTSTTDKPTSTTKPPRTTTTTRPPRTTTTTKPPKQTTTTTSAVPPGTG